MKRTQLTRTIVTALAVVALASPATGTLAQTIALNNNPLLLRASTDNNHALRYFTSWNNLAVDGPVLYGYGGGALGMFREGIPYTVLHWNTNRTMMKGKLGLGVDNPDTPLSIRPDAYGYAISVNNDQGTPLWKLGHKNGVFNIGQAGVSDYNLAIGSNGNVGIGTGHPYATLDVNGTCRIMGNVNIGDPNTKVFTDAAMAVDAHGNTYALHVKGRFHVQGKATCSEGFINLSDARYKTHVATFDNALDAVLGLRGVTYEWKRDEFKEKGFSQGRQIGLIAQEVEKVLPELVYTDEKGYKSVAYTNIVPVLVEAVKTLHAKHAGEIKTLKAENAEIKARLVAIEQALAERSAPRK